MEGFKCSTCGNSFPSTMQYTVDGKLLCPDCAEQQTVNCSDCGNRILKRNNKGDKNDPLCIDCWYKMLGRKE